MRHYLTAIAKDEAGAAGVEYGILVAAISVGIVAVSFILGGYQGIDHMRGNVSIRNIAPVATFCIILTHECTIHGKYFR